MPTKNSQENRERLAKEMVESWSKNELLAFAVDKLAEIYEDSDEEFHRDWASLIGE